MPVVATRWRAECERCGEAAPEERDSQAEAERDLAECPCRGALADGQARVRLGEHGVELVQDGGDRG